MKTCTTCAQQKPLEAFPVQKKNKSGRAGSCNACSAKRTKAWIEANREKSSAYFKARRQKNPEAERERSRRWMADNKERRAAWREQNADRLSEAFRSWRLANPEKLRARGAERRSRKASATLAGDFKIAFSAIYERAALLTSVTGVEHHVDHIVPLKGETVCGLHVPWNLQCIPALDNIRKKNRF